MEAVGGAAGRTAGLDPSDQTARLQRRMKDLEKERGGGGGKAGSEKEKDQVCVHYDECVDNTSVAVEPSSVVRCVNAVSQLGADRVKLRNY